MIKKGVTLLTGFFCFLITINGQDTIPYKPKHLFGIYSGLTYHILRDEAMFPDVYFSGAFIPIYVNYRYYGINIRQTCSFYFDRVNLFSSNPYLNNKLTTENTNAVFNYSYNRRFLSLTKYQVECFIGADFQSLLNFRLYNDSAYYENEIMCDQFTSLGINVIVEKRFLKNNDLLCFSFNTPFISYSLVNNVYNQWVNNVSQNIQVTNQTKINFSDLWKIIKDGELISFNKLIEFQTELYYIKYVRKHIGIELTDRSNYYSFAQYKNILYSKNFNNQIMLGLIFQK